MLILHGDQDTTVQEGECIATEEALVAAGATVSRVLIPDANHGYGFYSDQPDVTQAVEGGFSQFFAEALK